jgi:hypothetical protein
MAKTLAELISDAAAADDLEFSLPDGSKYKLADLRGFRSGVETERQTAERARKEAERVAQEAKDLFNALKSAQEELAKQNTRTEPTQKGKRWQDNPLYDELVPVIEAAEKEAKDARALANAMKASLDQSQAIYALERMRREWAEAKIKPKDKRFEEVVAEVIAAKELDDMGLPTLTKYLHRTSEPDRIKQATEEAVAAAKKEWEKAQRAADIPKPGRFRTVKTDKPPISKIDDLNSEAILKGIADDSDFAAAMEGGIKN